MKPGVDELHPPMDRSEFKYIKKSGKPPGLPDAPNAVTLNEVDMNAQASVISSHPPHSVSPPPRPWPSLDDYLRFADIAPDDIQTHKALDEAGIATFVEFMWEENSIDLLMKCGMKPAPAARLKRRAPAYCNHLKEIQANNENVDPLLFPNPGF